MKKIFKKAERLNKKTLIEELFQKGSYFYSHPFKVYYLMNNTLSNNQVLISVPKRNFKQAVKRNLLKRRIRESYRLNKEKLQVTQYYLIGYIYTSRELLKYKPIELGVVKSMKKLSHLESGEG